MTVRAEHVGSLLRPPEVLAARSGYAEGSVTLGELREAEDRAILAAVAMQREVGLEVATDGELRRGSWVAVWLEALNGIGPAEPGPGVPWHDVPEGVTAEDLALLEPLVVTDKLERNVPLTEIEADFLLEHARGRFKVTLASPTMIASLFRPGVTDRVYPTPRHLLEDAAALQIAEIETLVGKGVDWIQLDSLRYLSVIDEQMRSFVAAFGVTPEQTLAESVEFDNRVIRAAKACGDVTVGLHFCRGNNRSAWIGTGGYEPVAEQLLGQVEADRFLLEYDTERAGGFEPLRFVPPGKIVVLGLISSKTPQLESKDELRRRIEEASRYVPLENLALSPQCGFASTLGGNLLTVDDQRRKLELVVETAAAVWG